MNKFMLKFACITCAIAHAFSVSCEQQVVWRSAEGKMVVAERERWGKRGWGAQDEKRVEGREGVKSEPGLRGAVGKMDVGERV
jgi:hypothetical protein